MRRRRRLIETGEDAGNLVRMGGGKAAPVVPLVQPPQSLVSEMRDHVISVTTLLS